MSQHDDVDRDGHDRDGFDRDDDLRALLGAADPAALLDPVEPSALTRLVEAAGAAADGRQRARRRRPLTWLAGAAAAAVVVTAGAGAIHGSRGGDDTAAVTSPAPTSSAAPASGAPVLPSSTTPAGPTTSTLTVSPAAFDARCAVPNATTLRTVDTAFAGTVTAITGSRVTLQRASTFHGDVADTVTVRAPARDLSRLVQTVRFEVGGSYLVSATGGQVTLCGFTGPAQQSLQGIYTEAFPR